MISAVLLAVVLSGCGGASEESGPLTRRGEALVNSRQYVAAVDVLREATRKNPNDAEAWFYLGLASEGTGDWGSALQAYHHATHLKRDHSDAWRHLAMLYGNMGRTAEAWETTQQLARVNPDAAAFVADWLRARFPQEMPMLNPSAPQEE
jgi:tetratricopeptide (TPR) repeat protein